MYLDLNISAVVKTLAIFFLVPLVNVSTSSAQDEAGVAKYIKSHPDFRGYLTPHPPFPTQMQLHHLEGNVTVQVVFSAAGDVSEVKVTKSSGYHFLDTATVDYIKRNWRSTLGKRSITALTLDYRLYRR